MAKSDTTIYDSRYVERIGMCITDLRYFIRCISKSSMARIAMDFNFSIFTGEGNTSKDSF